MEIIPDRSKKNHERNGIKKFWSKLSSLNFQRYYSVVQLTILNLNEYRREINKSWKRTNGDKRKFVKNGFLLIGLKEWTRLLIQLKMIQLFNNLMGGSFVI